VPEEIQVPQADAAAGSCAPQAAGMTPEQLAEAKEYGRLGLIGMLADMGLDLAYLAVAAVLLARPIDAWLADRRIGHLWSVRLALLFLVLFAIHVAVSLPLSFWRGYLLEHRFHLSKLSVGGWAWRYIKQLLLAVGFGLVLYLGLYWVIWTTHGWWWLLAALGAFLVSVVLARILPVLILPIFYKSEPLDSPELAERIGRRASEGGLHVEGVYRLKLSDETTKANAMLAGLGRTRRVLLGDTLLDRFTPEEIEIVFAHEVGHHVFRHIRKMLLADILLSAAGFWVCDRLLVAWLSALGQWHGYGRLPVWTLPMVQLTLMVFGLLLGPIMAAVSRRHERQCDRYALERTGLRAAYLSAFRKLAQCNKDNPCPPRLEVLLFHDHPPIAERLAMGEGA
jgi:STE24 endopeptidase